MKIKQVRFFQANQPLDAVAEGPGGTLGADMLRHDCAFFKTTAPTVVAFPAWVSYTSIIGGEPTTSLWAAHGITFTPLATPESAKCAADFHKHPREWLTYRWPFVPGKGLERKHDGNLNEIPLSVFLAAEDLSEV